MNASMILRICLLLFLEVGGDRVFRPVDTKCIPICSNWKEKGWVFNCDGDNTACDWQCSAQRKACPEGLTYHCAADYRDFELHTGNINYLEECALEKPCKRGEEPSITLYANGEKLPPNAAKINCIPCSNKYFYNSQDGRLSSSYSRCFQEKFNKCVPEDNKIDCGESWIKRTESDGYCRCDARSGFAPENENIDSMCFYTDENCMSKKCPSKQELALNYTCISNCPDGYHRTDDSDICVEGVSATAKTKPPTTASSTTDQTYTQSTIDSTTEKEKVVVSSEETGFKWIVTGVVLGAVVPIAWILITIFCHKKMIWKECHEKGWKEAAKLTVEKALCHYSSCFKAVETSREAVSTHIEETQQELLEEDQSLLPHVEQGGTGEAVETSREAASTHIEETQQELLEEDQSLLPHVEQVITGVPWKRESPSPLDLWNVASLVGKHWKGLGIKLDISNVKIDQIEYDNRNNGHIDVVHGMLREWQRSRSHPTLSDLKDAILQSGVDFHWDSEKLKDILDQSDQKAVSNDSTVECVPNAVSNVTIYERDRNVVSVDTEMNNTIDAKVDVHADGSSVVRISSIANTSSIASRCRTDETQV